MTLILHLLLQAISGTLQSDITLIITITTEFLSARKHNHFNVQVLIIFKYCFVCREIGDYERAESCYKKAVKLKPQVGHI